MTSPDSPDVEDALDQFQQDMATVADHTRRITEALNVADDGTAVDELHRDIANGFNQAFSSLSTYLDALVDRINSTGTHTPLLSESSPDTAPEPDDPHRELS